MASANRRLLKPCEQIFSRAAFPPEDASRSRRYHKLKKGPTRSRVLLDNHLKTD